jgi:ATP-dependent exoDNAse (exonuclease V) beta subunit
MNNIRIPDIPSDIFTAFNHVKYFDEPHKYFIGDKELISVTTIIHKYVEEFDEEYWSDAKGEKYKQSPDNIKYLWKFINEKGTTKGSKIHDYTENLFLNKIFPYPEKEIVNHFGFDPVLKEYNRTKNHVDAFYKDVQNKLIPIKTELVVCDEEFNIGGMVDMLFYNIRKRCFQIWDWKTNKKLTRPGDPNVFDNFKGVLSHLDASDLNVYSLQLELYKYIIEKYTSIKLGDSYIVWFSHNNLTYEVIKTLDMKNNVQLMLNNYKLTA